MKNMPGGERGGERPDRIVVLFTPELGRRIREMAERERRPLTAQIQLLVERALEVVVPTVSAHKENAAG